MGVADDATQRQLVRSGRLCLYVIVQCCVTYRVSVRMSLCKLFAINCAAECDHYHIYQCRSSSAFADARSLSEDTVCMAWVAASAFVFQPPATLSAELMHGQLLRGGGMDLIGVRKAPGRTVCGFEIVPEEDSGRAFHESKTTRAIIFQLVARQLSYFFAMVGR